MRRTMVVAVLVVALSATAGLAGAEMPGNDSETSLVSGEEITIGETNNATEEDIEREVITLVTGETLEVVEKGDRRQITVTSEHSPHAFATYEDESGEYVVPHDADLDVFSENLFNIDLLLETDADNGTPVILRSDAGVTGASSVASVDGIDVTTELEIVDAVAGEISPSDETTARALSDLSGVDRVYLDATFETATVEPELFQSTDAVQAEAIREQFGVDGNDTTVAVLDTGIDDSHPDFGNRVIDQVDFSGDGTGDVSGHGTHVAGIVAGDGTESDGSYVGVAPGADLMDVKVLGDTGTGDLSGIVQGIEYAVEENTDIISMSLGGPAQEDDPIAMAVKNAADEGVPVIVSAGNEGDYFTISSPGHAESAITVGMSQFSEEFDTEVPADWISSAGPTNLEHLVKPEVVAPGTDVLNQSITAPGSQEAGEFPYTGKQGTSMAAPHVSGIAALLLEMNPDMGTDELEDRLVSTADSLDEGFADPDVFQEGGGAVRGLDAVEAELHIHDAVTSFGLYEEPTIDTEVVPVENIGNDTLNVDASVELDNIETDTDISDQADLNRTNLTIEPGETEHVKLEINTTEAIGLNSGVVEFEANDTEYTAPFGFLKGIEVVVDKVTHEDSSSAEGDHIQVWDEDGNVINADGEAFSAVDEHRFLIFEPMNLTAWSQGHFDPTDEQADIQDEDPVGDPVVTITEDVHVDFDDTTMTLYENETQPLELDTIDLEHEPLEVREIEQTAYAFPSEDQQIRFSYRMMGEHGVDTVHYTPFESGDVYEWSTEYVLYEDQGTGLDTPHAYHIYYEGEELPADGSTIEADQNEVVQEDLEFHRSFDLQNKWFTAHVYPVNYDVLSSYAVVSDIGLDRTEQTWYRTPELIEFSENWYSAEPGEDNWTTGDREFQHARTEESGAEIGDVIFDADETYRAEIGSEPLLPYLNLWNYNEIDDELIFQMLWHADQADNKFHLYNSDRDNPRENTYELVLDGETINQGSVTSYSTVEIEELLGSTMELHLESNRLLNTLHPSATEATATVQFEEGTANAPPQIEQIDVERSLENEISDREQTMTVTLAETGTEIDEFEVYYGIDVEREPFDWTEASVEHVEGTTYEVTLDTTGMRGALDFAFHATDADGNSFEAVASDTLQLVSMDIEAYTNEDDIVDTDGVFDAIDDWRAGDIETDLLFDVIAAWRSGDPIT